MWTSVACLHAKIRTECTCTWIAETFYECLVWSQGITHVLPVSPEGNTNGELHGHPLVVETYDTWSEMRPTAHSHSVISPPRGQWYAAWCFTSTNFHKRLNICILTTKHLVNFTLKVMREWKISLSQTSEGKMLGFIFCRLYSQKKKVKRYVILKCTKGKRGLKR